ncbi:phenylacetate-CoA ligase [Clostridium cavendishii DSM 21758]|uniref:Phenylacetate-CoA ligase n=1 Tax=Clostridium cavendishii DSM 21758 TaxID=1121302 RepID=A0A1M6IZU3_9CLOT|nr:AMP-binding protein [Clostridium cavendishii]SHJ39872.1 phenylacetate-CoA ligase [Clostridium cavendishii DSM 21758]
MLIINNNFISTKEKLGFLYNFINNNKTEYTEFSVEEKEEYTLEALKSVCNWVFNNNKFYNNAFSKADIGLDAIKTLDDFKKIPFLTKEDLRKDKYYTCSIPSNEIAQVFSSTGTTGGKPIYMFHSWEDLYIRDLSMSNKLFDILSEDVVLNALPYEMSSSGLSFHNACQSKIGATVISTGKGGFYSTPEKTVEIIRDLKPTIIITTPTYAMYIGQMLREAISESNESINVRKIYLTGEGCSKAFKNRLENLWDSKCYAFYGSLEAGQIGVECSDGSGYHIYGSHTYVEIVDPKTGEVLPEGSNGEVVITTLLRKGSPLVRYRTGDLGYIKTIDCACGIKDKKLFLIGRTVQQVVLNGKDYSPIFLEQMLLSMNEVGNDYRFIVNKDNLTIKIVLAKGYKCNDSIIENIENTFMKLTGIKNKVIVVPEFPRCPGKVIRVLYED